MTNRKKISKAQMRRHISSYCGIFKQKPGEKSIVQEGDNAQNGTFNGHRDTDNSRSTTGDVCRASDTLAGTLAPPKTVSPMFAGKLPAGVGKTAIFTGGVQSPNLRQAAVESTSPQPSPQRGEGEEIYSSTGTTSLSMM
jgi:hypothetical protein